MDERQRRYVALFIGGCIAIVAFAFIGCAPKTEGGDILGLPKQASGVRGLANVPCYVDQGGASIIVGSGCTIEVDSGGMMSFDGGIIKGHHILGTATPATVVSGTALAPGAARQPVSIATAGTVPLTIPSAGVTVCIWNTGSQAVTIADSGNQVLAGNFAMGQYDVLCGFSDGTRFIEINRSNN